MAFNKKTVTRSQKFKQKFKGHFDPRERFVFAKGHPAEGAFVDSMAFQVDDFFSMFLGDSPMIVILIVN